MPVDRFVLLEQAWKPARASGVVGEVPVEMLHQHALGYINPDWRRRCGLRVADCGTGAGVLGVLLALELPDTRWTLVDSSERRCDLAMRAVRMCGLVDRVRVEHATIEQSARSPETRASFDVVVARRFGPSSELAECGLPLLNIGGELVVSVSDETSKHWQYVPMLTRTGCRFNSQWSTPAGKYVSVQRIRPSPEDLPRRRSARKRSPIIPAFLGVCGDRHKT